MANVDRPNGFRFVKSLVGAPTQPVIRHVGVADGADIGIGDAISLSSGLAGRLAVEGECLGVAIGFGKLDSQLNAASPYNPDNLSTRYYDDSANTHTDWVVFYIPAETAIFEAQTDAAATLVVGEAQDIVVGSVDTTTGLSSMEIDADGLTNDGDVVVVEIPQLPDNDPTAAYGRYWVKFVNTAFANV